MFDEITSGEFKAKRRLLEDVKFEHQVSASNCWIANVRGDSLLQAKQNAEFICFCFNLQQKYDIGLLSVAVDQLQKILDYWDSGNFTRDPQMWKNTREIINNKTKNRRFFYERFRETNRGGGWRLCGGNKRHHQRNVLCGLSRCL